jgi:hypothetical protein
MSTFWFWAGLAAMLWIVSAIVLIVLVLKSDS